MLYFKVCEWFDFGFVRSLFGRCSGVVRALFGQCCFFICFSFFGRFCLVIVRALFGHCSGTALLHQLLPKACLASFFWPNSFSCIPEGNPNRKIIKIPGFTCPYPSFKGNAPFWTLKTHCCSNFRSFQTCSRPFPFENAKRIHFSRHVN